MVPLSGTEFKLLRVFLAHPDRVLTRDQLIDLMISREAGPFDRAIDVQVSRQIPHADLSRGKARELVARLTQWQYYSRLFLVPFGEIQREGARLPRSRHSSRRQAGAGRKLRALAERRCLQERRRSPAPRRARRENPRSHRRVRAAPV